MGELIPLKNVNVTIEALHRLGRDDLSLTVVGDGPQRTALEELVRSYRMEERVRFLGRVPRVEVLEHMARADCFVMANSPETFGLVYVAAMGCGCYVIGSKGEGIDGVIVDGKNGALVEPGSVDVLAKAMSWTACCIDSR